MNISKENPNPKISYWVGDPIVTTETGVNPLIGGSVDLYVNSRKRFNVKSITYDDCDCPRYATCCCIIN